MENKPAKLANGINHLFMSDWTNCHDSTDALADEKYH